MLAVLVIYFNLEDLTVELSFLLGIFAQQNDIKHLLVSFYIYFVVKSVEIEKKCHFKFRSQCLTHEIHLG